VTVDVHLPNSGFDFSESRALYDFNEHFIYFFIALHFCIIILICMNNIFLG
jgi:hypothetical protein